MPPIETHPIKAEIDKAYQELAAKGTEGASEKAILLAGIGYLADMWETNRNHRLRTRREIAFVGLEKGGPWAVAVTLLAYFVRSLIGA